ncbi:protein BEAN1 [Elgaria multicarinata webbii]|uniref:protein BEAN1 n=1 Tax=Elgaria multicarinata webbii TaxID=159646 RepID=UPI002FCCDF7D
MSRAPRPASASASFRGGGGCSGWQRLRSREATGARLPPPAGLPYPAQPHQAARDSVAGAHGENGLLLLGVLRQELFLALPEDTGNRNQDHVFQILFFHLFLILGCFIRVGTSSNFSKLYKKKILPCKQEELHCGYGVCLMNWQRCHYEKDCDNGNVSMTLTCPEIDLNKTSPFDRFVVCFGEPEMTDSSVLVAGVVIGVVLFLSCVAIIIGSLRKNRCFRHLQLRRDTSYTPDCFSYGGSVGELRSSCIEEFPPSFYFSSYVDSLSQVNIMHPDSPPRYDECVGANAAQIDIPTDDPPPYSLIDPCRQNDLSINLAWEEGVTPGTTTERDAGYLARLQDLQPPIPNSLSSPFPMEAAPPYETVLSEQNVPILRGVLKNFTDYSQTFSNRII